MQRFWRYYGGFLVIPAYLAADAAIRVSEITRLRDDLARLQPGFEQIVSMEGPRCGAFRSSNNAALYPDGETFAVLPGPVLATASHPSALARYRSEADLCGRHSRRRFGNLRLWDRILLPLFGSRVSGT